MLLTGALALATPAVAIAEPDVARAADASAITITVRDVTIGLGRKVVVEGSVTEPAVSRVELQQKRAGTRWRTQGTATVRADGTFRLTDKPTTATLRSYRVVSATGPHLTSRKQQVGVYTWRDVAELRLESNVGWKRTRTGFIAARGRTSGTLSFEVRGVCTGIQMSLDLGAGSEPGGSTEIAAMADDSTLFNETYGLHDADTLYVRLPEHPWHRPTSFRLTYQVQNPTGAPQPPAARARIDVPQVRCTNR